MKEKIRRIVESIFSIFVLIAVVGGGIVFLMFTLGIIIGGPTGESLAVNAKNVVMPIFIRCGAVAVAAGLAHYYTTGQHALTMEDNKD